ncbi:MAG: N-acetylmuramoyl-L-alanine amidase [Lachnospiraceae bacterium]|nr:N-acetylmuramoyl-L-alanine amidase [Lachnospiraceae bacterium]
MPVQFVYAADVQKESDTDKDTVVEKSGDDEVLLNYLVVDKPYVNCGETQSIVVSVGGDGVMLDSAQLTYHRQSDGNTYTVESSEIDDDALLFEIDCDEESDKGIYILDTISYAVDGVSDTINLSDIGICASYGVEIEAETNPDAIVTDKDADYDLDINVIRFDENGDQISESSIEEAIAEQQSKIYNQTLSAYDASSSSGNVIVVLDPGHDSTHIGASANGFEEYELTLKIAQYCKEELETYYGVTVYMTRDSDDCPYPDATSSTQCNKNRVAYAADVGADVYVAIHLNSASNTSANGAEVYYPNSNYNAEVGETGEALATSILEQLVELGLADRGIKLNDDDGYTYPDGSTADDYTVINNSKLYGFPGIIVEHAFLTNESDVSTYLSSESGLQSLGVADATGIANYFGLSKSAPTVYDGVDYAAVYDYEYYISNYEDLAAAFGDDAGAALLHFVTYGMSEGRQASEDFDVSIYKANYYDLQQAYGDDLVLYYLHYINYGEKEGRNATTMIYTPIMNEPTTTVLQMMSYYNANASYPSYYSDSDAATIYQFCQIYYEECVAEGVDPAVAFCQAMKETGFLKFGGSVPISAYNFCGLGATDSNSSGYATFSTVRLGIRAHVQHLKAYGSTDSLNNTCVDPRFSLVTRGSAIYVEWLGQNENPNGYGWATSVGYGYSIRDDYMARLYAQEVTYSPGCTYYFKNSISSGSADFIVFYGRSTDEVLVGDWDGDGVDTLCVRRGNAYYFSNSLSSGDADKVIYYGRDTDEVLVGDWNGDGVDTLCVRRGDIYYIMNSISSGDADIVIHYGRDMDEVLIGDWNGDSVDTLCVRRGNAYYISNSLRSGDADEIIYYGRDTDEVLVGDWDGDSVDTFCVRRDNIYYFKNSIAGGFADMVTAYGRSADEVLIGDWDGDGVDTLCVRR